MPVPGIQRVTVSLEDEEMLLTAPAWHSLTEGLAMAVEHFHAMAGTTEPVHAYSDVHRQRTVLIQGAVRYEDIANLARAVSLELRNARESLPEGEERLLTVSMRTQGIDRARVVTYQGVKPWKNFVEGE